MSIDTKIPIKLNVSVEELDKDGNVVKQTILKDDDIEFVLIQKEDKEDGSIRKSNNQ